MTEPAPAACGPPWRDAAGTWRLSRHADVARALSEPCLVYPGQGGVPSPVHLEVRDAAVALATPAAAPAWRDLLLRGLDATVDTLVHGGAVDLVAAVARPWSEQVALQLSGLPAADAAAALDRACRLYEAAAASTDGAVSADSLAAATALARALAAAPARTDGAAAVDVQSFVALSQTLPALLAGAWLALLRQPAVLAEALADPAWARRAAAELLRLGGPAQAVYREAGADLDIGGARLCRGDRVALQLAAANRDPAAFPDPHRLDPSRRGPGHFALGAGTHRCGGASMVHMLLVLATEGLLARTAAIAWAAGAEDRLAWRGGGAMCAPSALWVVWRARPTRAGAGA